jgi:putative nucleotidyltransferase with HDIG domain
MYPSEVGVAVELAKKVEEIVGAKVYLVGGSVRDQMMNLTPKDFDFCTALDPDTLHERVKAAGRRAYTVGKRFGTIGFKLDGHFIEVTTFRTETYREGCRRPDVEFVDNITHDLSRRDFTMNAVAMSSSGRIVDPFGGAADIAAGGIIRAVGNPRERMKEDPLRMLRAARFAAQFGFYVEVDTQAAITRLAHRIQTVSRERWMSEMDKLLVGDHVAYGLTVLEGTKLLRYMFPELWLQVRYNQNNPHHDLTLWGHTSMVVERVPSDLDLRWAALLHDIGKPYCREEKTPDHSTYIKHDMVGAEMVEGIALRLKWSTARRERVVDLVRHHMDIDSPLREADYRAKGEGMLEKYEQTKGSNNA